MIEFLKLVKGLIWKLFNFLHKKLSVYMFRQSSERAKNVKGLGALKNAYEGKRIFIVCTGPSLKPEDLDKIAESGDYSFACNKIDKMFCQTKWRPTFYTVFDERYGIKLLDTMNSISSALHFYSEDSYLTTRKVQYRRYFINAQRSRKLLDNPDFSNDVSKKLYAIATVTYAMLQIAVYMGFKELYIIGCDHSYNLEIKRDGTIVDNGGNSYFKGSIEEKKRTPVASWEADVAYDMARKYADSHGIVIKNAGRGGKLENFERVDFDSLF